MNNFMFEYPYSFLLLLLILCIYRCPVKIKQKIFPHLHLFTKYRSFLDREKFLYSLILSLLVIALSSPISYDAKLSENRKGRDLVFVVDTSGSMGNSDYSKEHTEETKFSILRDIIRSFIKKRFDDNVGVSVFGTFAFSSVPLTYDMKAVAFLLDFIDVGIAGENTAIGDAIDNATELLKHGNAKNRVMILMTDGYQNSGSVSIATSIENAKKMGIKIYTIGIGASKDFDAHLLKKIAKDTGAKMFTAKDEEQLVDVYNTLDALEPSPIRSQNFLNKQMLFAYPLAFAVLLLLYLLSKRTTKWSF